MKTHIDSIPLRVDCKGYYVFRNDPEFSANPVTRICFCKIFIPRSSDRVVQFSKKHKDDDYAFFPRPDVNKRSLVNNKQLEKAGQRILFDREELSGPCRRLRYHEHNTHTVTQS